MNGSIHKIQEKCMMMLSIPCPHQRASWKQTYDMQSSPVQVVDLQTLVPISKTL